MKTVIYYTSNREDPVFEQKIIDNLLLNRNILPIISVSQKPMDLGKNICVGDVGLSYLNEWNQILIGCKEAETEHIITAESDFLYPREYFEFEPGEDDIYQWGNIWICWKGNYDFFHRKRRSEGAMIINREFFIEILEKYLSRFPKWTEKHYKELQYNKPTTPLYRSPYRKYPITIVPSDIPCVSFKTGKGCNFKTGTLGGSENISKILPHWGHIDDLKKEYL